MYIYIYIYCLLQWNVKKIVILGVFAECHGQGTRQSFFKKKILCRVPRRGTRQSIFFKKIQKFFAECLGSGTRQSNFFKKKTLPSAWAGTLSKVIFKKNKKKRETKTKNVCRKAGKLRIARA